MRATHAVAAGLLLCLLAGCGASLGRNARAGECEEGLAVYYSDSLEGHRTANGETYDKTKLTAAHLHLPFGTIVRVVRLSDRRSVEVRINDRGPFGDSDRIIDLSRAAAERLDMMGGGIARVRVEVVALPGE
jgi:rare lipoprotein A